MESVEETRRFEVECEFVQALTNPHYINRKLINIVFSIKPTFRQFLDLAQRGYFKERYFINYLKYLLYFKRPEYARCVY